MIVVDSSGWMHYFMNGDLAESYAQHLSKPDRVLTPTVILYEVFKKIQREYGREEASVAAAEIEKTQLVPFSSQMAYHAADISSQYHLSLADSMIYATAHFYGAKLVTSDADFKDLPNVVFLNPTEPGLD